MDDQDLIQVIIERDKKTSFRHTLFFCPAPHSRSLATRFMQEMTAEEMARLAGDTEDWDADEDDSLFEEEEEEEEVDLM